MRRETWWAIAMAGALSACGGGGGGSSSGTNDAGAAARVVLSATGPSGRVAAGSTTVLDVVVTNTGTATATHVITTVFAFAGARLAAIDCTASGGAVCPFASQELSLVGLQQVESFQSTAPTLPPQGSLHFRVTELILPGVSGPTQTRFSVTADGQVATADTVSDVDVDAYVVQLSVSGGALTPTVMPGGTATYVMSLSNAGPDSALSFRVTNDVGPHQSLVSATCVAAGGAVCPAIASNGASMTVPSLPVGSSLLFTMTAAVAADATGVLSDVFTAIDPGDRFGSDNSRIASIEARSSAPGSFLTLRSAPGEPLGQGAAYAYTNADAVITVSNDEDGLLYFAVAGNEEWRALVRFSGPPAMLQPGTYQFAPPAPGTAVFALSGNANGCNEADTELVIDSVAYAGAALSAIDLRFDYTCRGSTATLHGQLHWTAADTTQPPGPLDPPPATLWRAPAAGTPSAGNYIYLGSDPSDVIGGGKTTVLTQANAIFDIASTVPGQLTIRMQADDDVYATFRGIATDLQLQRGFRGPLESWPTNNPTTGSMTWSQGGLGCNAVSGWFVIDDIRYAGSTIASVDARFEQHCDNAPAALRGQIHWAPGDPTMPPGPVLPPPADLWSPPAGATPAAGNYVYLQSDPGDFVGGGATWLFTAANSTITASATGADVQISTASNGGFGGEFVGMNSISQLQRGYYAGLKRFPFNNPTKGGLMVGLLGGCNALSGWFVVDDIAYVGGTLTSIDLRFEQHCEGAAPALHGKIHWSSS